MREGVDSIRVRAEGAVEVLEAAAARFTRAAHALDTGEAHSVPRLTEEEQRAIDDVSRLDSAHESVRSFREAEKVFKEASARFVTLHGVSAAEHLPILHEATIGFLGGPPVLSIVAALALAAGIPLSINWLSPHLNSTAVAMVLMLTVFLLGSRRAEKSKSYRMAKLLVTSKALVVDRKEISLESIEQVAEGPDASVVVKHRGGSLTFRAGEKRGDVMAAIERARLARK